MRSGRWRRRCRFRRASTIPASALNIAYLASIGRAEYPNVTDDEVIDAFRSLSETEGIIPALESAHTIAWLRREADSLRGQTVLVNLSGRGDKDVAQMMEILEGRL